MTTTEDPISLLGRTNARSPHRLFGIRQRDRLHHIYVIGKTGTGKSTLLEALARQDLEQGRGFALIDPHGDLAKRLASYGKSLCPERLHYLDAPDLNQPFGYNPLRGVIKDRAPLAASGLLEAFQMLWPDAWGVRMEHLLRNALHALIEAGGASLADIPRILVEEPFRLQVLRRVTNEQVLRFWSTEFPATTKSFRQDAMAPVLNKVGALLTDPRLYRLFVNPPVDLHFREIMDKGEVLIANLSKGEIGSDSTRLLGALLVTTLSLAAMSRASALESARRPFYVYVDEFQDFTTLSVASMASELRKFGIGLTFAHQHLDQLKPDIRSAVLGNAGTMITFRLGAHDAQLVAPEFAPVFGRQDLTNLPNYNVYLKLMIDGEPSVPFSATTGLAFTCELSDAPDGRSSFFSQSQIL